MSTGWRVGPAPQKLFTKQLPIGIFDPNTRPIRRQQPLSQIAMHARIRPIHNACDEAMLHGIPVNVIHVTGKIHVVTNLMLPETLLP